MGTPGIAGTASPPSIANPSRAASRAKRSVMSRFTTRVTVPVGILVLIWAGMTAATLGGVFGSPGEWSSERATFWTASICAAAVVIVVVALVLTASFVREMARETNDLAVAAQRIADVRLPAELEVLRAGSQPGEREPTAVTASAVIASSSAEIGEVSAAIADLHSAALAAASSEAGLRNGLRQVLVSLGRRNQSLIHRQLRIIDKLEKQASGSTELGDLFTLDHLTTRMRRHAESLAVLAGEVPGRSWSTPVPVIDVMRAAAAEVEDYKRVIVRSGAEQSIAAPAVTDMIHLLAELIENATLFSPSTTKVEVRAESVANGFVIEIEDRGLGIPSDQLHEINARLADPPDEDLADADRLGLFVAARLAARHSVQVSLNHSAYRGTKAVVVLPKSVVVTARPDARRRLSGEQEAVESGRRLNLQAPGVLALAGSELARRPDPVTAGPSVFTPSLETLSSRDNLSSRQSLSAPETLSARDSFPGDVLGGREALPRRERAAESEAQPRLDGPPGWDAMPRRGGGPATDAFPAASGPPTGAFPTATGPATGGFPAPSGVSGDGFSSANVIGREGFSAANGLNLGRGMSSASGRYSGDEPGSANAPRGGDWRGAERASSPERASSSEGAGFPANTDPLASAGSPPNTGAGADGPARPAPAKPGLPRRVRPERSRPVARQAPPDSPVPDQARSLASSLQSSWRRSQQNDDIPGPGPGSASEEES
jgi:signal transduction histidine kinase